MDSSPAREIETLRGRLEAGDRGRDDTDRDLLLSFSDRLQLLREEYGDHRHIKLLRHATRCSELGGSLSDALDSREAAEDIVRWIHANYENEETNRDYRVALRMFGRHVTSGDDVPETLEWISTKTSRSYDPSPDPALMLDWRSDVLPMIEAARNPRDAALVALQFDAGLRGGELYDLERSAVSDTDTGLRVRVDGKTGERSVTLIPSVPYVTQWLASHPGGDDDYMWTRLGSADRFSYQRFLQCFDECAERAGVTKPVTPTNFRKSNATWLAKQGANAALIEDRQGRTRGSDAVARYVAAFGSEAETQYARIHGVEVDTDDDEPIAPLDCPRCGQQTPRDKDLCVWCGQALAPEAAALAEKLDDVLVRSLAEASGEQARELLRFRDAARENPELQADAISELTRLLDGDHDESS